MKSFAHHLVSGGKVVLCSLAFSTGFVKSMVKNNKEIQAPSDLYTYPHP